MGSINCPNCNTEMRESDDPDVAIDVCPKCGGQFFDKGELNELATGVAGDVEGRSLVWTDVVHAVEDVVPVDELPQRECPRCNNQPMKKIGLVTFAGIVFDYCPKCEGFFLDVGEVGKMNQKLKEYSGDGLGDEYRGYHQGFLVRGNKQLGGVSTPFPIEVGVPTVAIQTVVYFDDPLDLGLHVYPERLSVKLAKVFGLFGKQDITTGDEKFDAAFIIQGNDEAKVQALLSPEVRKAILDFTSISPRFFHQPGVLRMFDHCLCYTEGPYVDKLELDWQSSAAKGIINGLVGIAVAMK